MRSKPLSVLILFMLCLGCVEPFSPNVSVVQVNAMVVDGYIDAGGDAIVKLTRALPLLSFAEVPKVTGAIVTIESSDGESFNLAENSPATYSATNLDVNTKSKYTLHVRVPDGNEFISDQVTIHPTPPVGKVYYTFSASGDDIELRTDSEDTNPDGTGYYLWECMETYEYRSTLFSRYKRVNGVPLLRRQHEYVDTCWRETPIPVIVGTTKRLSKNLISGQLLTRINKLDLKISRRYRIAVRQRAISEQEFIYRTQLKKTSDLQGSLFAEIPGPVVSNVRSTTNSTEYVLGYFRGQQVQQKVLYVSRIELPQQFQVEPPIPQQCGLEAACPTNMPVRGPNTCIDINLLSDTKIVITSFEFQNSTVYTFAPIECGDCRVVGGKTEPPPYWF